MSNKKFSSCLPLKMVILHIDELDKLYEKNGKHLQFVKNDDKKGFF